MKQKHTWLLWGGISMCVICLAAIVGWGFRDQIFDLHSPARVIVRETAAETSGIGVRRTISYDGRIREAKKLIEHEYYSLATVELSHAITQQPNDLEPYELLGEVYLQTRDHEKLRGVIKRLESVAPGSSLAEVLRGRLLIAEEKFADAVAVFGAAQALPSELQWYYAVLLGLQNDHARAKEILEEIQSDPEVGTSVTEATNLILKQYDTFSEFADGKNPHLFALIAKQLAELKEGVLAREWANVAIREDIEYVDAWLLRGYAQMVIGENKLALLDLEHAYELDPVRPETQYFLALTLHKLDRDEEAALFFEKCLEYDFAFSDEIKWKLIEIFSAQQKWDQVVALYQQIVEEDPTPTQFVSAVYTSIDVLKKPGIALQLTQELLEKNPDDLLAINLQAWALIANERFSQADDLLGRAKKLDETYPRTYLNLGLLNEKQGKLKKAKEWYKMCFEVGQGQTYDSVINLAVDRYNALIDAELQPEEPAAASAPSNSP